MIIATHSGKFHADDIWGVAALMLLFPDSELVRSRDEAVIARADFAVDVGGEWNPQAGRFDHHQKGFRGARPSGVVYASAGLVWKQQGPACVSRIAQQVPGFAVTAEQARHIAEAIDTDLVQYLDMSDTGAARSAPGGYGLSAVISGFNPNWLDEQQAGDAAAIEALRMARFRMALGFMKDIIVNAVKYRIGGLTAVQRVRQATVLENGLLLLIDNASLPWASVVRNEMPGVLFVISHSISEDRYMLHAVPSNPETFEARRDLPAAWAGLRDAELAAVTGVPDAQFCHNGLFIAAAKSYEGALQMARLALAEPVQA
ncbi:MYG1 family protein [Lacisediminimonas sp.]|uniref:MYG1 family protein n=1 Tax=Lacisediminimonas sp. TaxID=3060582 RepID=UPI0027214EC5|nr:MYG1 family protein [Lacisediminimonas sp.]MDO8298487.1 MYG1 family protein [Lacisediminimonas sp.]MDO9219201.1 MYG1 family protein [Lacisediminimonas sp.]